MIKLFRLLKPYTLPLVGILILTFIQSISQLYLPTLMSDIVDIGIVNGDIDYIIEIGGLMLLATIAVTLCTVCAVFLSAKTAAGFSKGLRHMMFSKIANFSLAEFEQFGTASLITRTTNDITHIQHVLLMLLRTVVSAPLMIIGGIIMAVSKDAVLSLLIVAAVPIITAAVLIFGKNTRPLFKQLQEKIDQLNLILRENLNGIRVIRAFNRTDYEINRFQDTNLDLFNTALRVNRILAATMPLMSIVLNFTIIAVIWFGSIRIDAGYLQVGDLMAFIQYIMLIMFSVIMFSMIFMVMPRASASAARINEVLETAPQINDPHIAKAAEQNKQKKGCVEFKNVTFRYPGAEKPALSNISFIARPGETTAIIGGTGAGKTTLVNLILRFYDVDSGSLLVDGIDVRQIPQQQLRAKIGFVPQKAVLFTGTVADNIRYGKEDATIEEIKHAARIAQASEFISNMKDKYNAVISQGGTNISGGQKQRLAIARALVKKPEIYIFDDCFSALDFKTHAKLRAALKTETAHATTIIVAQRVSTVMNADQIIVLNDGRIVGSGKHQELLKSCSLYQEIVSSQLAKEDLA